MAFAQGAHRVTSDLELMKERYALAVNATDDGLWDWDLINNKIFYSKKWKSMLGYKETEKIGDSPNEWFERLHPDDREKLQFSIETYFKNKSSHFKAEYRIRHKNGHYLWALCQGRAVWDEIGKPIRFIGFQTDISVKKNREEQLFYDAFHDPLTGTSNRALFIDRLTQALLGRTPFAVLYMDMDHFKEVNDTLGHKAGDELLILTAKRLEMCSRAGDTIARFGGDEFTILLNNIKSTNEVEKISKRIIKEVSLPFLIEKKEIYTNITIGIALGKLLNYKHPEEVIRDADLALYQAKEKNKGGYEIFNTNMLLVANSHLKLATDLKNDIKRGKILFYYQPIINLSTGKIVGLEALLRWEHDQYGILKPADFLELAIETKLIIKLEKVALDLAHKQFKGLQMYIKNKKFFITFNISEKQLQEATFIKKLKKILKCPKINSSLFHLEISEKAIMKNPEYMEELLKEIKKLGFKLSLDNFGTGYSSLTYLHRYPFNFLKIDRSLIAEIEKNPTKESFLKNMIKLAKSLGMIVIAEGVESESILKILRKLQCKYAQGFYFSKPQPTEKIIKLLKKNIKDKY